MSLTARLARLPAADSALPPGVGAGTASFAGTHSAHDCRDGVHCGPVRRTHPDSRHRGRPRPRRGRRGDDPGAPIRAAVPPGTAGPHAAVLTAGTGPAPAGTAHPAGTAAITQPPAPPPVPSAPAPPAALVRDVRADVVLSLGADLNEGRLAEGSIRNRAVAAAQTALRERSRTSPRSSETGWWSRCSTTSSGSVRSNRCSATAV